MSLENIHPCPGCGADLATQGVRVFTPIPCPICGMVSRGRAELAGYQLGEAVGRGGLGLVFRATDSRTGAGCALKLARAPSCVEPGDLDRFVADTRTAAALNHSHCVRIFDTGSGDGFVWVAMDYLAGGSLADLLASGVRLGEADTLSIGLAVASALAAANRRGLTHRDLEPGNLVFDKAGAIKVTDFGQAALYERSAVELGVVTGRPSLVAAERLAAAAENAATDIYALGATLFYALTGVPPYDGEPHGQMVLDRMSVEAMRIEDHTTGLHQATTKTLNRMLAPNRVHRIQTWEEVIAKLTHARTARAGGR